MEILILLTFVIGYGLIAFEHSVSIDKAATALVMGTVCWGLFVLGQHSPPEHLMEEYQVFSVSHQHLDNILGHFFEYRLLHHLEEIASILFFLLGAMTIVELVDKYQGFSLVTNRIKTVHKVKLLWVICILSFFFSAALDNLTTSIVMISLLRKLITDKKTRWFFAGFVVIAANAGGAWSPIGDVTTTMLWIGGQITTLPTVTTLFLPSLVALIVPLTIASFLLKGSTSRPERNQTSQRESPVAERDKKLIFGLGVAGLLFVPVFKTATHLPPFMGMMLSLGLLWTITELLNKRRNHTNKKEFSVVAVLQKIDTASVLFFLGILLAVAALSEVGHLVTVSNFLRNKIGNVYGINLSIGLLSAIVDNVPLVAASMQMYEVTPSVSTLEWDQLFIKDGIFWQFLAYCAGTGGSALIIGSASGVAVMGLEKIDFFWYLKNISFYAIIGFFAGAFVLYMIL